MGNVTFNKMGGRGAGVQRGLGMGARASARGRLLRAPGRVWATPQMVSISVVHTFWVRSARSESGVPDYKVYYPLSKKAWRGSAKKLGGKIYLLPRREAASYLRRENPVSFKHFYYFSLPCDCFELENPSKDRLILAPPPRYHLQLSLYGLWKLRPREGKQSSQDHTGR